MELARPLLLDGGMGSELKRRGAVVDAGAWSAAILFSDPASIRDVHLDYLRAGANVITTNTFASNRFQLAAMGMGSEFEAANALAVRMAQESIAQFSQTDGEHVQIAGSMSNLPPGFDIKRYPPTASAKHCYTEMAHTLAELGVDVLLLEMLQDTEHAVYLTEAALGTGLPVWSGVSCRRTPQGLVGFDRIEIATAEVLDALIPLGPDLVGIMHTPAGCVVEALEYLRTRWPGPLAVYPELEYRVSDDGGFETELDPVQYAAAAAHWLRFQPDVIGGCCGTTPAHIHALKTQLRTNVA